MMTDKDNLMNEDGPKASDISAMENDGLTIAQPEDLKQSRYSSIGLHHYFTEIEKICREKGINPENVATFFKTHWLRDAVGGSFSRAQEAVENYKDYIKKVPEEARTLDIPADINTALYNLMSLITWFYRLSYTNIQSESVKYAEDISNQLQQQNTEILEQLSQCKDQVTVLTSEKNNLLSNLEQQRDHASELEGSLRDTKERLAESQNELQHANNEIQLIQQTVGTLSQQLSERKQELASQQEYQKHLTDENKSQQVELTAISSQCEHLKQTVSDLKVSINQYEKDLSSAQSLSSELRSSLEEKVTTLANVQSGLNTAKGENEELRAEAQRLTDENKQSRQVQTEQAEELHKLRNQIVSMEATLNAEKTIAESLRGTVDKLTAAMTGAVTAKSKSPRTPKTRNQRTD